jgi:hypothetical protein
MSKRGGTALCLSPRRRLAATAEDSERPSSCIVPFFAPTHHSLFRSTVRHDISGDILSSVAPFALGLIV